MELFAFVLGLLGIAYGIWALISPFIVFGLNSRVMDLEGQLQKLKKEQRDAVTTEVRARLAAARERPADAAPVAAGKTASDQPQEVVSSGEYQLQSGAPSVDSQITENPWVQSKPQVAATSSVDQDLVTAQLHVAEKIREYRQARDEESAAAVPPPVPATGPADVPVMAAAESTPTARLPKTTSASDRDEPTTLEEILAGKWLTWVGALAVIIGAGFGFKYAVENNWVGPRERVIIGILTGLACFAGGAYAIRRNYVFLAQGLTGSALGILYLSLYAAFGWYGILSYESAFVGMILTTTLGLSFAGYFNVQPTAVLGMIGGFLTPAMLWPSHDPMWTLFPYLLMLDLGVLLIAGVRRWAGLEILAFCGTLMIWLSWHHEFYRAELMPQTTGFMTAFLLLFALLSVWHNVIRKRTALAGDFFLIFATPTAYFAALYALTFARLPHWQGEFALSMMTFYAVLAGLAAVWHPAGKSIIAALAGLASTFLILAAPLELTGHWVAICWIAQAVLLVELGLYFRERTLAWTGLALLVKVQAILLIYFLGTLADPVHFQTAFVRIQLHLIGRPETPIDSAESWMSLINGRSLSYLADVIGFSILAWEFSRRRKDPTLIANILPGHRACQTWLNVTVPLVALAMIVLETFVWGVAWRWDAATIISAWTIWTAIFACVLILWSRAFLSRGIEALGWVFFALLLCFAWFNAGEALHVISLGAQIPPHRLEAWWLVNPRGISLFAIVVASGLVALIYAAFPARDAASEIPDTKFTTEQLTRLFGTGSFVLALGLAILETHVWGAHHHWLQSTALSAFSIWTTLFLLGATFWRSLRNAAWVEKIVQGTFVLLSVWFIASSLVAAGLINAPQLNPAVAATDLWLLNPRGIGFLVTAVGCAICGLTLSRLSSAAADLASKPDLTLPRLLGSAAYIMGLIALYLETGIWGVQHGWLATTILSACTTWTTIFLIGAALWRIRRSETWVDQLVLATFWVLEGMLVVVTCVSIPSIQLTTTQGPLAVVNWWVFNPRGIGFLVSLGGCALAAVLYGRSSLPVQSKPDYGFRLPQLLGVGAFLTGLVLMLLESCAWEAASGWLPGTLVGTSAMWFSLFAVALVAWSVRHQTQDFDVLIGTMYVGLVLLLLVLGVGGVNDLAATSSGNLRAFRAPIEMWFWNPRFIGFLMSTIAAAISSQLYRGMHRTVKLTTQYPGNQQGLLDVSSLFAIAVYLSGVVMFTLEVYSQGISRDWHTATSLAVTLVWTTYATLTLIAGIFWRSGWVRVFSLGLFVLTVFKVFLFDVWHLETVIRVFAFISLGVALLLVSFLYRRFRDRIRSWMAPELEATGI